MPAFIPGLELCRLFHDEVVSPILHTALPGLQYSAARIGSGSDVLGFDTEMSMDHDWGPRVLLLLGEDDRTRLERTIHETLRRELPATFMGFPTGYESNADGTQRLAVTEPDACSHLIEITTIAEFFNSYLGFDMRQEVEPADWLTFPEQKLRTIVDGVVFHDDIGLQAARNRFDYYPNDVWLYLLAAAWNRIGQEEHLMGRAGYAGDELGSALIGSRLVRDVMRLCFLMERRYAPYPKWFGTAFRALECAPRLEPVLLDAIHAPDWSLRESALADAYEIVASMHNALGITQSRPAGTTRFFNRPFRVIHLEADFAAALRSKIQDPEVRRIAAGRLLGGIDLISDNTDLLCDVEYRRRLRSLYDR